MDKYYYSVNSEHFYYGVPMNTIDIEVTQQEFEALNGKEIEVVDGAVRERVLTFDEKIKYFEKNIQDYLDFKAKDLGYDDINSIGKYLGYENVFRLECEALGSWCASVWAYCYQALAEVQNGTRVEPTVDELISELPILTIP